MRNLEHEIAKLENRLRTERRDGMRAPASVPRLPVEVLEPDAEPEVGQFQDSDYEVVGFDEEGVEIVYVGEAAQDRSVRPKTSYLTTPSRSSRSAPPNSRSHSRSQDGSEKTTWTTPTDRLVVTDGAGPTVSRQMANARPVSPQARRTTNPSSRQRPLPLPPSASSKASSNVKPRRPSTAPDDRIRAQYNRYYQALRAGNHSFAVTGFRNFIERHPRHDFADNARYWLAEAYYDRREYQVALKEFLRVRRDYPQGNKVPAALLKAAFCHISLGDADSGRYLLLELIQEYPKTKPAVLAAQRLETLGKK